MKVRMSQSIEEVTNKMKNLCHSNQQQNQKDLNNKNSSANNNDETFISEYLQDDDLGNSGTEDGRISGGSNSSSAFYDDDSSNLLSSSSSNDGQQSRASSSQGLSNEDNSTSLAELPSNFKLLNPISNLAERNEKYYNIIERIRTEFLESISGFDEKDLEIYEQADLIELRKPLAPIQRQEDSLTFRLISRYVTNNKIFEKKGVELCKDNQTIENCIKQGVESLNALLKFRNHYKLTNILEEEFSREFYIMNGAFVFGHDKQNLPVFYLRARIHRRWSKNLDEAFRRYLSWQLDIITKSNHGVGKVKKSIGLSGIEKDGSFGICFDCADIGYPSLDMDFLRFITNLLIHYYPTYCRYALCVDLPWLFRSVWKLVRSWLPEDARETVQLITSKQLTDFIDEKHIPNSIKFNDLKASEKPIINKHKLPENWSEIKGIEEFTDVLGITPSEAKQFKAHVEKFRKEYESLGAI